MGNFKFSGHQTFVFRYGWLVKGVDLIRQNPLLAFSTGRVAFFQSENRSRPTI